MKSNVWSLFIIFRLYVNREVFKNIEEMTSMLESFASFQNGQHFTLNDIWRLNVIFFFFLSLLMRMFIQIPSLNYELCETMTFIVVRLLGNSSHKPVF